ncbi:MAG: hypothetical protein ACKOA8_07900 [Deltaproteobacteria bacterium]
MPNSIHRAIFGTVLLGLLGSLTSCSTLQSNDPRISNYDIPQVAKNTLEADRPYPPVLNRTPTSSEPLITYCEKETASAANPQEKKWRDAFSFEVMDRICNKEVEVAKRRIDFQDRNQPKYLDSSWVNGINLTGVQLGWPRGTAITSRHLIYTQHLGFHGQVGESIRFLTMDNRVVSRKIIEVKYLSDVDLTLARLESDLPGSITPLKVLDPASARWVPDLVPLLRIDQQSKALLVMKRGDYFARPGENFGTVLTNPPELAYAQYYQDMIRFDSSSPSILLLRTSYGVMPILYSLVTWGGTGDGPILHQYLTSIQSAIESFGDSHRLDKAMPPVTSYSAPSCSMVAKRSNDGLSCDLTVISSADPVTGNPAVEPYTPPKWEVQANTWKGKVSCPSDPSILFQATLSGPGGRGKTCESAPIGPLLPQCTISVLRRGATAVCDVTVTRLTGNPSGNPILTPSNPSSWTQQDDRWISSTSCPLNTMTTFSAKLTDEVGQGPACSTQLEVHSEIPTCEMSSRRIGYEDTCEIIVTRKSGIVSGNPSLMPSSLAEWVQEGDNYKTNLPCSGENILTYAANFSGPLGAGPVCKSPSIMSVPNEVPFCELQANRRGLTSTCNLKVTFKRGWVVNGPPIAAPVNPRNWKKIKDTLDFESTVSCPLNTPTQFSAYYPGLYNIPGRPCLAPLLDKIPAPSCSLEVKRQKESNRCSYTLSATSALGTIASYNVKGGTLRSVWSGANPIKGQMTCSQTTDSTFTAYVWGRSPSPQSGTCQASVPKLTPPFHQQ